MGATDCRGRGLRARSTAAERRLRAEGGFTLIELLVTLAIAAVLLTIAIPSFNRIIISNRLSAVTNEYVAAMNQARLEAVKRNASTQFCGSTSSSNGSDTLGTACGSTAGAVYVLNSDNTTTQIQGAPALPPGITLSSVVGLRYRGQGLARTPSGTSSYTGLVADISSSHISSGNHRCLYVTTGTIISSCSTSSACTSAEPASCEAQ